MLNGEEAMHPWSYKLMEIIYNTRTSVMAVADVHILRIRFVSSLVSPPNAETLYAVGPRPAAKLPDPYRESVGNLSSPSTVGVWKELYSMRQACLLPCTPLNVKYNTKLVGGQPRVDRYLSATTNLELMWH